MKKKTISQIHQQTLDIVYYLNGRKATKSSTIDMVIKTHNRYLDNIATAFGVLSVTLLTLPQWEIPITRDIYTK